MMTEYQSLAHVKWECKYHIIIVPKYRKKVLYGQVRKRVGQILRSLAKSKGVEIIEGYACLDHIHLVASIPPKYSISGVIGFMKGKSAIYIHREFARYYKNYHGKSFWSRGYFVTTVGLDEEKIKKYVRNQEKMDKRVDGNQIEMSW